jgi:hypothetical protein
MPTVAQRLRDRFSPDNTHDIHNTQGAGTTAELPAWAASCLNCGQPLAGAFCSNCGQRAAPPHPKVSELAGDAFAELSGWDGKFIDTFRLLLTKPGELTRRFIEGQRVRFIAPVRLYLTLSLVYFVVAAGAPTLRRSSADVEAGPVRIGFGAPKNSGPDQAARATRDARAGVLTPAERDSALKQVAHAPRFVRPILQRSIDDPEGIKRGMLENLPRVLFVLLPVFAGFLALFYRRRHFPEHLYFAIHLHAFAFLVLLIANLASYTHLFPLYAAIAALAQVSLPVYMFFALRRVYGGSVWLTLVKELGVGVLYSFAGGCAMLGLVYWAAVSK